MGQRNNLLPDRTTAAPTERNLQPLNLLQLDHHESRRRSFTAGFVVQVIVALGLIRLITYAPVIPQFKPRQQVVELIAPTFHIERPKQIPVTAPPIPKVVHPPLPVPEVKQPETPPPVLAKAEPVKPIPQPPVVKPVEKPVVALNNFSAPNVPAPAPPKPTVKTDVFANAPVKHPTVEAQKVQTGGFGDENGFRGQTTETTALNAPKLGSFDKASGPGNGNGSGGAKGAPGVVANAGFGSQVAASGNGTTPGGGVRSGGFGDAHTALPGGGAPAKGNAAAAMVPVEVLDKPQPQYTSEARDLKIEGEVHLKVLFQANGRVQVLQVVRGLGHGLDEAATTAAQKIRFKPAQRDGQPCDMTATVHIVFQLAS